MVTYQTPGVYYERVDASPPAIAAIRTDIAGIVGIATRGPVDSAVPIQSWRQFQAYFGDFSGAGYLGYAVRAFFENGGRRCWVVRVASRDPVGGAAAAETTLRSPTGTEIWRIAAFSPGVWGNGLTVEVQETHRAQTVTVPAGSDANASVVRSTSGFMRASLVRLSQGSLPSRWKVVTEIDPVNRRLMWVPDALRPALPYDAPLTGFKPDVPMLVESVEYTLIVRELGRLIALYQELSVVPEHPRYGAAMLAPLRIPTEADVSVPSAPAPIVVQELRPPMGQIEPIEPRTGTTLSAVLDPTHLRVVSSAGIKANVRLELLDPSNRDIVLDPPLTVLSIDLNAGNTVTLATPLTPAQQAAQIAALGAGRVLDVRVRGRHAGERGLDGGTDGLALLQAYDFMGVPIDPLDRDEVKVSKRRGIRALEPVGEVAMVAVPDIHIHPELHLPPAPPPPCIPDPCLPMEDVPPAVTVTPPIGELPPIFTEAEIYRVQAALVQQCEDLRDRIALLDPPLAASRDDASGAGAIRAWRSRFDSTYATLFYPWIRVVDPLRSVSSLTRDIPPSGHAAGQYANTDLTVGVHKAPANNALIWAQDVTVFVGDALHGVLNPLGINVVRPLRGRGIRLMGARTVSSDPDWRYVNVRRLLLMIEQAVYLSTQWAVFEPNDYLTRAKLRLSLTSFLLSLWQRGALMGDTAPASFFVTCDETNNPPAQRENGMMLAEVGVAPSKPFEFIVLRVGRTGNEFEIVDAPALAGGR